MIGRASPAGGDSSPKGGGAGMITAQDVIQIVQATIQLLTLVVFITYCRE